jgi:CheY-like chemotaxis protein
MTTACTILLAEDSDTDALLMQRAFMKSGLTNPLARVHDGVEAIDYLAGNGVFADREKYPFPVLLLLDLKMPRRDGFEVLQWIRSQPVIKRLPVCVLTASDQKWDVEHAYEMGANSYLQKPTEFLDLVQLLKTVGTYWRIVEKPEGSLAPTV